MYTCEYILHAPQAPCGVLVDPSPVGPRVLDFLGIPPPGFFLLLPGPSFWVILLVIVLACRFVWVPDATGSHFGANWVPTWPLLATFWNPIWGQVAASWLKVWPSLAQDHISVRLCGICPLRSTSHRFWCAFLIDFSKFSEAPEP